MVALVLKMNTTTVDYLAVSSLFGCPTVLVLLSMAIESQ